MAEFETITYAVHDGVATITLNRPKKLNALNAQAFGDLGEATERAATDSGIRVVLVRGAGRSFSAGIDVTLLGQLAGTRGGRFKTFLRIAQRPYRNLTQMEKPAVAAVQGHALGAGCQLALACDMRILTDDAKLALPEIRFGLIPDLGGPHALTRLVGPARAKELVWTGRTLEAQEAERLGLANRLVPEDRLEKEAEEFARGLVHSPPIPVGLAKSVINHATEATLETSLEQQGLAQAACIETEDHREAVEAYLEKRTPRFKGR